MMSSDKFEACEPKMDSPSPPTKRIKFEPPNDTGNQDIRSECPFTFTVTVAATKFGTIKQEVDGEIQFKF